MIVEVCFTSRMNAFINTMKSKIPNFLKGVQQATNSNGENTIEEVNTSIEFNEPSTPNLMNVNTGKRVHVNRFNANIYKNFGGSRKRSKSKASRKSKKSQKTRKSRR
jgi:hypothetical protein